MEKSLVKKKPLYTTRFRWMDGEQELLTFSRVLLSCTEEDLREDRRLLVLVCSLRLGCIQWLFLKTIQDKHEECVFIYGEVLVLNVIVSEQEMFLCHYYEWITAMSKLILFMLQYLIWFTLMNWRVIHWKSRVFVSDNYYHLEPPCYIWHERRGLIVPEGRYAASDD